MGGIGSGRWSRRDSKSTTDEYRKIDVRRWARESALTPGQHFMWNWKRDDEFVASIQVRTEQGRVFLIYRSRGNGSEDWTDWNYPVHLDTTPCHLGSERHWFLCPGRGCGRRVALLYGGDVFVCRHCRNLAYESQREQVHDRLTRKADRIRDRLGWEPGCLNGWGPKPKGMHRKTFERLVAEHDAYVDSGCAMFEAKYGVSLW